VIELVEIEADRLVQDQRGDQRRPHASPEARARGLVTAAALAGRAGTGKVVCIVSGGNIDLARLAGILEGGSS
jgi:threonine dehydratase